MKRFRSSVRRRLGALGGRLIAAPPESNVALFAGWLALFVVLFWVAGFCAFLNGCQLTYDSRETPTCDEVVFWPPSSVHVAASWAKCVGPTRVEVRPDGLVVCRCPSTSKDGGAP